MTGERPIFQGVLHSQRRSTPICTNSGQSELQNPRVVYEDDLVVAVFYQGNSDYLVITFGDKVNLARGTDFFGDKPLIGTGTSTLGIMAKSPHWYPEETVKKVLEIVEPLISPFTERIGYGGSMGGYAVLKYAAWFDLTTVISLCPQFSIDNNDLCGLHSVFYRHFTKSMAGMGIRATDRSGRAFVFFDPSHREDAAHAALIQNVWPETRQVRVWMVGHGVTSVFAGTTNLADLIQACRRDDSAALKRFAGLNRRSGSQRFNRFSTRLLLERPDLTLKFIVPASFSGQNWKSEQIREVHKRQRIRILELFEKRAADRLSDYDTHISNAELNHIRAKKHRFWSEEQAVRFYERAKRSPVKRVAFDHAIHTVQGTILAFDYIGLRLIHLPAGAIEHCGRTVGLTYLDTASGSKKLRVSIDGNTIALSVLNDGTFLGLSPKVESESMQLFRVEKMPDGTSALQNSSGYLSAKPDGSVFIQRGLAGDLERFLI